MPPANLIKPHTHLTDRPPNQPIHHQQPTAAAERRGGRRKRQEEEGAGQGGGGWEAAGKLQGQEGGCRDCGEDLLCVRGVVAGVVGRGGWLGWLGWWLGWR